MHTGLSHTFIIRPRLNCAPLFWTFSSPFRYAASAKWPTFYPVSKARTSPAPLWPRFRARHPFEGDGKLGYKLKPVAHRSPPRGNRTGERLNNPAPPMRNSGETGSAPHAPGLLLAWGTGLGERRAPGGGAMFRTLPRARWPISGDAVPFRWRFIGASARRQRPFQPGLGCAHPTAAWRGPPDRVGLFEKGLCILARGPIRVRYRRKEIKQCDEAAALFHSPLGGPEPTGNDVLRLFCRFRVGENEFSNTPARPG